MRIPRFLNPGCVLAVVIGLVLSAAASQSEAAGQRADLDSYPAVRLDDLQERYRSWIEEDVGWLITNEERNVFLRLERDAQRDAFMEGFWRQRDPSPGTVANEYREQHYERLEYASENFGRETTREGWETDRGRVWILLGRPQTRNRLPNTSSAVPAEVWFYSVDPMIGLPPFFYLIFFRDNGVGAYRLYSPAIDGPTALLNPSGKQGAMRGGGAGASGPSARSFGYGEQGAAIEMLRQTDQELGTAAASLVPGDGLAMGASPLRSEMVLAQLMGLNERIMPRAIWAYRVLTGVAEAEVRFETLAMRSEARVYVDPSGLAFIHYVTQTRGSELNLNAYEDRYYVTFSISSTVRDAELRFVESGEPRTLQADLDEETTRRLRNGQVQFMDRLPMVSGEFTLDLVLENNVTREFAQASYALQVPGAMTELRASAPLLVLESRRIPEAEFNAYAEQIAFQLGPLLLIPALDGPFATDGTAEVFWQIHVPAGQGMIETEYALRDAAGNLLLQRSVRIDPSGVDSNGILNHVEAIDLRDVPPGDYVLTADVVGDDREPTAMPLRLVAAGDYVRPFVHALPLAPASSPEVQLIRATQLRTLGRTDEAIAVLDGVLRREPDLEGALDLQVDLLTDAGRYRELDGLLTPRLVQDPGDTELLQRLATVKAELGEHYDAIRYLERARLSGAEETPRLLFELASEYYAEGQLDRARELLERSLQLDPEQPQVRRLLDELLGGEQ